MTGGGLGGSGHVRASQQQQPPLFEGCGWGKNKTWMTVNLITMSCSAVAVGSVALTVPGQDPIQ